MTKIVPHTKSYNSTNFISKIQFYLRFLSTLILILTLLPINNHYKDTLNTILAFISTLYFISEFIFTYAFTKAEQIRIEDLIDNSLNSKIAEENSIGYYTNNNLAPTINKLGVNAFENAFFSKNIVNEMIIRTLPIVVLIVLLFLASIFFINKNTTNIILQLLMPLAILKEFVYLLFFKSRVKNIYDNYVKIYNNIKKGDKTPLIINNIISYEKLLSSCSIQLDSEIYNRLNDELSKQWEDIKAKYKI